MRKLVTSRAERGLALLDVLAARLAIGLAEARALVAGGAVFVDRRREADPDRVLGESHKLIVHDEAAAAAPVRGEPRIAYEGGGVIVVDKPAGLAAQTAREGGASADGWLRAQRAQARLFHRIDRAASGLLIFTVGDAAGRMRALLDRRLLIRRYLALVDGVAVAGVIDRPVGPDPRDRRRMAAGQGQAARTTVRVLGHAAGRSLVELELDTGRRHQLRVHLADRGWPIVGDAVYGAGGAGRLCLHAAYLGWPAGEGRIEVASPPPVELVL